MPERLTRDDLIVKLQEQIELLQLNAENYDKGKTVTTLQIATGIRVLFHDTPKSTSLIKQICDIDGVDKNSFQMVSTKETEDDTKFFIFGDALIGVEICNGEMKCIPKLAESEQFLVPFSEWWSEDVVKNVSNGIENATWISREDLIKLHANKEGGSHVDNKKDKRITDVSSKEALGWTFFKLAINGERTEVDPSIDQKKATIRQVCYEVLISLYNHFPELFRETYF